MTERTDIKYFIPCSCSLGGLIVNGIEIVDMEGIVSIYHVHTYGVAWPGGIWQRIKNAWAILCGGHIMGDDSTLDKEGVTQLRNACQDALDRWPEVSEVYGKLKFVTIDDIYQSMQDEDAGRKMRLEKERTK